MKGCTPIVLLTVAAITAPYTSAQVPTKSQLVPIAIQKWVELAPTNYTYKLSSGGVFGRGIYKVHVRNGVCTSKHIGGNGIGKPRFLRRFIAEASCERRLVADLMQQVQSDLSRGFQLGEIETDPMYGFLRKANLDTDAMEDQGWGFEISEFKLLDASPRT